ncbi:hypothetical protein WR30_17950 [Burkholderia contaminans FFH2055]|uniref:hypothetical protein n=1 Tax=Burkholderia TaxID=32008 RepID=UPI000625135C|nr:MULTISPECIES: hypothetical protein [Burkholderia]KKL35586.1 hypothetical protein WR30_17950 [Burkholderia contaminans FFH2055]MEB4636916.1 hypothetical protein [Burkholderia contaminans]MEB4651541.1 hypothetical protein [Burkholderia contaminans]MEB4664276.1 hypothetical protein [Burkholderia contaminans]MEB4667278.1 hypothetical protein [Burkholderia contaminans]
MAGLRVIAARLPSANRDDARRHRAGECSPRDRAGPFAVAFESVHHAGRISRFLAKLSLTFVEMTQ